MNRYKDVGTAAKSFRASLLGAQPSAKDLEKWIGKDSFLQRVRDLVLLHKIRAVNEFIPELRSFLDSEWIKDLCTDVWMNETTDEELWTASLKLGIPTIDADTFEKACSFKSLELALVAASLRAQCPNLSSDDFPVPGSLAEASLLSALSHQKELFVGDDLLHVIYERIMAAIREGIFLFHHYDSLATLLLHHNCSVSEAQGTIRFIESMNSFSTVRGVQEKTLKAYESSWSRLEGTTDYKTQLHSSRIKITFEKSWKSKVKYGLLLVIHSKIVSIERECSPESITALADGLQQSLASNFLATLGSNLYTVLLKSMSKDTWSSVFLPALLDHIRSPTTADSVSMEYIKNLWIPSIVKNLPLECSEDFYSQLGHHHSSSSSDAISLQLSILKTQRMAGIVSTRLSDAAFEQLSVYKDHSDLGVRISCFAVVCQNYKKGVPPPLREFRLFLDFIASNLNVDSSSFRQKLLSHSSTLLLRVRDYSMKAMKKSGANDILDYMKGVHDLEGLLLSGLYPSGNYQITITSLSLLDILNQLFYKPDDVKFKSSGVVSSEALTRFVQERLGLLLFFAEEKNRQILLRVVRHYMEDVRRMGKKILLRFPAPCESVMESIMKHAEVLSNSSKISEVESSADYYSILVAWGGSLRATELLARYDSLLETFSRDVLKFVKEKSALHGLLHVMRVVCLHNDDHDLSFYGSLVSTLEASVRVMLGVMNVDGEEGEENPSFAQMGVSIESHIQGSDAIEISGDHHLILSCAWLNIKEAGVMCGFLVKNCDLLRNPPNETALDIVHRCCNLVLTILRCCRHKGVMEGTLLAVEDIANALLSAKAPWKEIPAQVLDKVLKEIVFQSSSATRRSAGIPLLLQGLVSSEAKLRRDSKLLETSIERLLTLSSCQNAVAADETMDSSVSHSLHILKSLVNDSSISVGITPFLSRIFIVCVNNFGSESWAIRNAALQLFGALQPRLTGQKRLRDEDSEHNMMYAKDFFEQNPGLSDYILTHLREPTPCLENVFFANQQVIMPLLALLSKLNNDGRDPYAHSNSYKRAFIPHFYSSVINVRRLAVRCFARFSTDLEIDFSELFAHALGSNSANFIHSMSLLLQYVLTGSPNSTGGRAFVQVFVTFPCFEIRSLLSKHPHDESTRLTFPQLSVLFKSIEFNNLIDPQTMFIVKKYESLGFSDNAYPEYVEALTQFAKGIVTSSSSMSSFFESNVKEVARMASRCLVSFTPVSELQRLLNDLLNRLGSKPVYGWTVCDIALRINDEDARQKVRKAFPHISKHHFLFSDSQRHHPGYFSCLEQNEKESQSNGEFECIMGSDERKRDLLHRVISFTTGDFDPITSSSLNAFLDQLARIGEGMIPDLQEDVYKLTTVGCHSEKVKSVGLLIQSVLCLLPHREWRSEEAKKRYLPHVCQEISRYSSGRISENYRLYACRASTLLAPHLISLHDDVRCNLIFESVWSFLSDENEEIRSQGIHFVSLLSSALIPPSLYLAKRIFLRFILKNFREGFKDIPPFLDFFDLSETIDLGDSKEAYLFESDDGLNVYLDKVDNYHAIRDEILRAQKEGTLLILQESTRKTCLSLLEEVSALRKNHASPLLSFSPLWSNKVYPLLVKTSCVLATMKGCESPPESLLSVLKDIVIS